MATGPRKSPQTVTPSGERVAPLIPIGYDADTQVPVVGAFDDRAFQRDLGPLPCTPLRDGVRQTIARFERLLRAGRLDTRELSWPARP